MDRSGAGDEATGGCQCGAIRYVLRGPVATWDCNVCHCRMCQKASGGPFMTFVNLPRSQHAWTRGEPFSYASSSVAKRGFCRDCGTPLTYERQPDCISISHGSLDDPSIVVPTSQLTDDRLLAWSSHVAAIPAQTVTDWVANLPEPIVSYQHPDRDA